MRRDPVAWATVKASQPLGTEVSGLPLDGVRAIVTVEDVERPKPAPDIYLHAAARIGVPIDRCAIIEDSEVGATGALASGARVIGLVAGRHCDDGHEDRLRALGVQEIARGFDEVERLLGLGSRTLA